MIKAKRSKIELGSLCPVGVFYHYPGKIEVHDLIAGYEEACQTYEEYAVRFLRLVYFELRPPTLWKRNGHTTELDRTLMHLQFGVRCLFTSFYETVLKEKWAKKNWKAYDFRLSLFNGLYWKKSLAGTIWEIIHLIVSDKSLSPVRERRAVIRGMELIKGLDTLESMQSDILAMREMVMMESSIPCGLDGECRFPENWE